MDAYVHTGEGRSETPSERTKDMKTLTSLLLGASLMVGMAFAAQTGSTSKPAANNPPATKSATAHKKVSHKKTTAKKSTAKKAAAKKTVAKQNTTPATPAAEKK